MSPNASLAYYKSNLDPPPVLLFGIGPGYGHKNGTDNSGGGDHHAEAVILRTPSRKIPALGGPPVTPKRSFSSNQNESPFRTPGGGGGVLGDSPFRTPGSRGVFDPHDPRALLDEELSRMGAQTEDDDSPGGLYGKGRGSLLYDSPGLMDSPGKWTRWW